MLYKNIIQKVSNMVLFKDYKLSSGATETCKYATKYKYMYEKKIKKNIGSSCSKNHKEYAYLICLNNLSNNIVLSNQMTTKDRFLHFTF